MGCKLPDADMKEGAGEEEEEDEDEEGLDPSALEAAQSRAPRDGRCPVSKCLLLRRGRGSASCLAIGLVLSTLKPFGTSRGFPEPAKSEVEVCEGSLQRSPGVAFRSLLPGHSSVKFVGRVRRGAVWPHRAGGHGARRHGRGLRADARG